MRFITIALCAALVLPSLSRAFELTQDRATLKGVKKMAVLIEEIDKDAPAGLTEEVLQTDVELSLRKAGIAVFPSGHGLPWVYVRVGTTASGCNAIDVDFTQAVTLVGDPTVQVFAATWRASRYGSSSSSRSIRESVIQLLEKFENDYLAVNPK